MGRVKLGEARGEAGTLKEAGKAKKMQQRRVRR
jgi:hypothetical protein